MSETKTVIDHIVLLKVRANATKEEVDRLVEGTFSLKAIPGVLTVTVGPTFVEDWMPDRRAGHTHVLSVRLESKEALKVYQDHELHVKVKNECLIPLLEGPPVAVDYESVVVVGDGAKV